MKIYNLQGFKATLEGFSMHDMEVRVTKDTKGATLSIRCEDTQFTIPLDKVANDMQKLDTI